MDYQYPNQNEGAMGAAPIPEDIGEATVIVNNQHHHQQPQQSQQYAQVYQQPIYGQQYSQYQQAQYGQPQYQKPQTVQVYQHTQYGQPSPQPQSVYHQAVYQQPVYGGLQPEQTLQGKSRRFPVAPVIMLAVSFVYLLAYIGYYLASYQIPMDFWDFFDFTLIGVMMLGLCLMRGRRDVLFACGILLMALEDFYHVAVNFGEFISYGEGFEYVFLNFVYFLLDVGIAATYFIGLPGVGKLKTGLAIGATAYAGLLGLLTFAGDVVDMMDYPLDLFFSTGYTVFMVLIPYVVTILHTPHNREK